jgi:hypothetical protein
MLAIFVFFLVSGFGQTACPFVPLPQSTRQVSGVPVQAPGIGDIDIASTHDVWLQHSNAAFKFTSNEILLSTFSPGVPVASSISMLDDDRVLIVRPALDLLNVTQRQLVVLASDGTVSQELPPFSDPLNHPMWIARAGRGANPNIYVTRDSGLGSPYDAEQVLKLNFSGGVLWTYQDGTNQIEDIAVDNAEEFV